MDSAILKARTGQTITAHSFGLPYTLYEDVFLSAVSTFLIAIAIIIAFAFISAFYASFLVSERENSAKHQQVGVSTLAHPVWATLMITAAMLIDALEYACAPMSCLQLVSGVSIFAYWLSTLTWDILVYQIPMCTSCTCCRDLVLG